MIEYLVKLDTDLFLFLNDYTVLFGWHNAFCIRKANMVPLYLLLVYFIARRYRWSTLWWFVGRSHCGTAGPISFRFIYLKMFFSAEAMS
jgi:hypothetical protein